MVKSFDLRELDLLDVEPLLEREEDVPLAHR